MTAEQKKLIAGTVTAVEGRLRGKTLTAEVIEEEFYGGMIREFQKLMPAKTVTKSKALTMSRRRFLRMALTVAATGAVVWGLGEAGRFLASWRSGLDSREDEALNGDLDALREDALKITNTHQRNYMAHYIDAVRAARESEEALYPGISAEEKAQRVLYMATRAVAFVLAENPEMRDRQVGGGPAVGHFQAEPQTIADTIRMVNNAREGSRLYPAKRLLEKGMWKESAVYDLIRSAVGPSGNTVPGKPVDAATIGRIINSSDIRSREATQFLIFRLMSFTKNMEPSAEEVKGGLMQNLGNEVESYLAGYNTAFSSETMMPRNEGEEDASMEVGLSITPKIMAAYLHADWLVSGAWLKGGNGTLEDILGDKHRGAFEAAYRKVESDLYYVSNVDTRLVQALRVIRFAEKRGDNVQNLRSKELEGWRSIIMTHRQRLNELVGKNAQGNMDENVRKEGKDVLVQAGKALEALKARTAEGFGEEAWGMIQTAAQDQYGHEVRAQRRILRKLDRVAQRLPRDKKQGQPAARAEVRAMIPVSGIEATDAMTAALAVAAASPGGAVSGARSEARILERSASVAPARISVKKSLFGALTFATLMSGMQSDARLVNYAAPRDSSFLSRSGLFLNRLFGGRDQDSQEDLTPRDIRRMSSEELIQQGGKNYWIIAQNLDEIAKKPDASEIVREALILSGEYNWGMDETLNRIDQIMAHKNFKPLVDWLFSRSQFKWNKESILEQHLNNEVIASDFAYQYMLSNPDEAMSMVLRDDGTMGIDGLFRQKLSDKGGKIVETFFEIAALSVNDVTKTMLTPLLPLVVSNKISLEEAVVIVGSRGEFFGELGEGGDRARYIRTLYELDQKGPEFAGQTVKNYLESEMMAQRESWEELARSDPAKLQEDLERYSAGELLRSLDVGVFLNEDGNSKEAFKQIYTMFIRKARAEGQSPAGMIAHHVASENNTFWRAIIDESIYDDGGMLDRFVDDLSLEEHLRILEEGTIPQSDFKMQMVKMHYINTLSRRFPGEKDLDRYAQQQAAAIQESIPLYLSEGARGLKALLHDSEGFPATEDLVDKFIEPGLMEIAAKDPALVFSMAQDFYGRPYGPKVLTVSAKKSPSAFLTSDFSDALLSELKRSGSPEIRALMDIRDREADKESRALLGLLFDDIAAGRMTVAEALEIIQKPFVLKHAAERIQSRPGHLGEQSIAGHLEMLRSQDWNLRLVLMINDGPHENPAVRFAPLEGASAGEMYDLVTYGEQEIQTSSFNGIFNRMLERMQAEHIDGEALVQASPGVYRHDFRVFISLMTEYNRLNEFFGRCSPEQKETILNDFASNIDKEAARLREAAVVADAFSMIRDPALLSKMQGLIRKEYQRVETESSEEGKILYGLLASMLGDPRVTRDPWFNKMNEDYPITNPEQVSGNKLFNAQGVNVQRYYFASDEDARASFANMKSQYADHADWAIEEGKDHIRIYSVNGMKIEIFANRPTEEGQRSDEIEKIFEQRNITPQVEVQRGHSYHAEAMIGQMGPEVVIVGLGACGGAGNTLRVLELSPFAHIFATKGTGTMHVNDPLYFIINEEIRNGGGKDLNLRTIWQGKIEPRLGRVEGFDNYVAPHENAQAIFIRTYQILVKKSGVQTEGQTVAGDEATSEANGQAAAQGSVTRETELGLYRADSGLWMTVGNPAAATAYAYPLADLYMSFLAEGEVEASASLQSAPVDSTIVESVGTPDLAQPGVPGVSQSTAALDEFLDNAARTGTSVPLPYGLLAAVMPETSAGVSDAYYAPESLGSRVALAAAQELKLSENALTASEWPRKSGSYPCYVVREQASRKILAIVFIMDAQRSKVTIYTATQNGTVFYDLIDQYAAQFPEKPAKESGKARKAARTAAQVSYDIPQLKESAATGDLKAAETLLELAQEGDPAAQAALQTLDPSRLVNSLTYRRGLEELAVLIGLVDAGNAAALNALKTLDLTGIKRGKTLVGDPNVRIIVGVLAGYGNPVAQKDYTYRQGDLFNKAGRIPKFAEAVSQNPLSSRQQFDVLTFLFLSGSPAASKAVWTMNVDKMVQGASGNKKLQDLLQDLAAMGNPGARRFLAGTAAVGASSEMPASLDKASLKALSVQQLIESVAAGQHPEAHEELLNRIVLAVEESALQGIREADVTALSKAAVDQASASAWSTLMAMAMKGHPAAAQALTGVKDGLRQNIQNGVNLQASVRLLASIHESDYYTTFQIQQQPTTAIDRDVLKTLRAIWGNPGTVPYRNSVSRYFDNTDYPLIIESLETEVEMSDMVHLLFWNELASAGSVRFMRDPDHMISLVDEYEALLPRAEMLNIEYTGRFTLSQLKEIVTNRENNAPDGRQLFIALYAKADWNNALGNYSTPNQISKIHKDKTRLMYFETGTRAELQSALLEASKDEPASIISFNFHGWQTGMDLGEEYLSIKNEEEFANTGVLKALKKDGVIVLQSCSTGKGREQADNVANMMRRIFPHAKYKGIYSLTAPGSYMFEFENDGKTILIDASGPGMYQAMLDLIDQGGFATPSELAKPEVPSDGALLASAAPGAEAVAPAQRSEAREVRQEDLATTLSQETLKSAESMKLGPDTGMIARAEEQGTSAESIVALVSGGFVRLGAGIQVIAALVTDFVSLTVKTLETIVRERIAPSRQDSVLPMGDLPGLVVDVETAMLSAAKWEAIEAILTLNKNQHYGAVFLAAPDAAFREKVASLPAEVGSRLHIKVLDATSPDHVLQNSLQKMFAEVQKGGQARAYRSVGQAFVITATPELCDKLGEGLAAAMVEIPAAIDREVLDTAGTAMAAAFSQELLKGDKLSEKTSQAIKQTGRRYQFNAEGLRALLTKITAEIQGLLSIRASA
ncbi:MAG: hypothetical protein KTQ49_03195 [Candidatus Omnitrophica bacterium]|nr:hypothetical protein [Candidatus Omnitrophota bacterium]